MSGPIALLLALLSIASTFGAGLDVDPIRLRSGSALRRPVLGTLIANILAVPLLSWLLLLPIRMPTEDRGALLLITLAPRGSSSPLLARLAGGEVTRTAAIYVVLAFVSAFMPPLLLPILVPGEQLSLAMLVLLVGFQLVPLALGFGLRIYRPAWAMQLAPWTRRAGNALLMATVLVLTMDRGAQLWQLGGTTVLAMSLAVAITLCTGALAAPAPRIPDALLACVRNLTLALLIAEIRAPGGRGTFIVATYGLVMYLASTALALLTRYRA